MNLLSLFDKLNKISLYLVIFLIPLFFLPFTFNVLDYPKQTLLLFLVLLSLVAWLLKQLIQGKIIFRENKLLYLALFSIFIFFFPFHYFFSLAQVLLLGLAIEYY